jgi:hypothetical protein
MLLFESNSPWCSVFYRIPQILGEAARAWIEIPVFVILFTLLVVLGSSISGDQHFYGNIILYKPPPYQDWGQAGTAGNRFARDDKKSWGPSWGKQLPGERPRETAETWHMSPQPSRHVRRKGAAPLSGAGEQTAHAISAYAQCACLLFFANGEYKLD